MRTQSTSIILCLLAGSAALSAQYVYMSSGVENSVYEYSIGGAGYLSFIGTVPAGADPGAVAVDPLNRFVYVANSGNSADPNQPPGISQFRIGGLGNLISIGAVRTPISPNTMAIDQKGRNLYVALRETGKVLSFRINPSGALTAIGAPVPGFPVNPSIAVDPKGRFLYVTGVDNANFRDVSKVFGYAIDANGVLAPLANGSNTNLVTHYFGDVQAIAVDPTGRFVYIAESDSLVGDCSAVSNGVAAFRIQATGLLTPIGNALDGCRPNGLAVDPTGQFVYMSNIGNDTASVFQADLNGALTVLSPPFDTHVDASPFSIIVDATGRYVYVAGQLNPGEVIPLGIANVPAGALFPIGPPVKTGELPGGIGTTSCTAPLPGANFIPRVTTTSLSSPVVTTIAGINKEPVTLAGSIHTVTEVTQQTPCPNALVSAHANLAGVKGVGPLSGSLYNANGSSSGDGLMRLPGTLALQGQFRVNAAGPGGTEIPLDIQSFVSVNSSGIATDVSVPPSGQVSWWKAEGNALDALGANDGADHGVPFGPGRVGQAFQFLPLDNVFPNIEVASSPSLQPAAVTVMAWVKHLGFPGVHNYVLSQGAYQCIAASYALYAQLTGLRFYIYGASEVDSPVATDAQVWDGNWHLVTGTYDGAMVRMFVDGAEIGNGTPTNQPINYNLPDNQRFYIGAYRGGCNLGFNGSIDEVRVFNRALSAAEIQAIYQSTPQQ